MERLTARSSKNNMAYLIKVKPNEQDVESPYPNTLKAIMECFQQLADFENEIEPRPFEEWGEEYGNCLWWKFPIEEPPYCGTPLDCDFTDYYTHFTRLIVPIGLNI